MGAIFFGFGKTGGVWLTRISLPASPAKAHEHKGLRRFAAPCRTLSSRLSRPDSARKPAHSPRAPRKLSPLSVLVNTAKMLGVPRLTKNKLSALPKSENPFIYWANVKSGQCGRGVARQLEGHPRPFCEPFAR